MSMMAPGVDPIPNWWIYPFKPVRVDPGIFERIDCSKYTLERKFDGWRAVVIARTGTVELWTREKRRIEMPENLREELMALSLPPGTVLDGEIWNPQKRGGWKQAKGIECRLSLWDILVYGRKNIGSSAIEDRRKALETLISHGTPSISTVEALPASRELHDQILTEAVRVRGTSPSGFVHGVVLKKNGSPRRDHTSRSVEHPDWLKIVYPGMDSGFAK